MRHDVVVYRGRVRVTMRTLYTLYKRVNMRIDDINNMYNFDRETIVARIVAAGVTADAAQIYIYTFIIDGLYRA